VIPEPWEGIVLVLATYRLVRLAGWDDWPPIYRLRAWIIGETWIPDVPSLIETGERVPLEPSVEGDIVKIPGPGNFVIHGGEAPLPGKTPDSEAVSVRPGYSRPTLAHLVHCPFCLSWWVSLAAYLGWLAAPEPMMYAAAPFALSAAVGLVAKNLDP